MRDKQTGELVAVKFIERGEKVCCALCGFRQEKYTLACHVASVQGQQSICSLSWSKLSSKGWVMLSLTVLLSVKVEGLAVPVCACQRASSFALGTQPLLSEVCDSLSHHVLGVSAD